MGSSKSTNDAVRPEELPGFEKLKVARPASNGDHGHASRRHGRLGVELGLEEIAIERTR
jgi:hypothetical protein